MKYLKTYEQSYIEYRIYFTHTKNGETIYRHQYTIQFDLKNALKKVEKLINSFLSLDKTKPRFKHWWSLDDYWIEIYKGDKKIETIDKQEIDARFDLEKYNL